MIAPKYLLGCLCMQYQGIYARPHQRKTPSSSSRRFFQSLGLFNSPLFFSLVREFLAVVRMVIKIIDWSLEI